MTIQANAQHLPGLELAWAELHAAGYQPGDAPHKILVQAIASASACTPSSSDPRLPVGIPDGWSVYRDSTGAIYVGVASGRLPGVWLYRDGSAADRMLWAYFDEVLDASPSAAAAQPFTDHSQRALIRHAMNLLNLRNHVPGSDVDICVQDLRKLLDGQPVTTPPPSEAWREVVEVAQAEAPAVVNQQVTTAASLPVGVPSGWWQIIHDTLSNYRMGTLDDGHGGGYPLIDAMTADGQPVSGGIEECTYLADAIWNAITAAPAAQPAADLSREVETMVRALEEGEWAEHAGQTELGSRLENAITGLINRVTATEKSAPGEVPFMFATVLDDRVQRSGSEAHCREWADAWNADSGTKAEVVALYRAPQLAARDAGDDYYPPCDFCGSEQSEEPWHGSGLINCVESRHIHACNKCRHHLPCDAGEVRVPAPAKGGDGEVQS